MGIGATGAVSSMCHALSRATEAVSRKPDAQCKIMLALMVVLAMIESIAIYALVISLIILYANPFKAVILG